MYFFKHFCLLMYCKEHLVPLHVEPIPSHTSSKQMILGAEGEGAGKELFAFLQSRPCFSPLSKLFREVLDPYIDQTHHNLLRSRACVS